MENVSSPRQQPPGSHARLIEILVAIDNGLEKLRPSEGPAGSHGVEVVIALFVGCVRLFRGVTALLEQGLAQEARTLSRTLLEDSTTLAYFHKHSTDLERLALQFVHQSLQQELRLMQKGKTIGLPVTEWEKRIAAQTAECRKTAQEEGWGALKNLPHIERMLKELDMGHLYFLHRAASYAAVHTSASTLASRTTWSKNSTTFDFHDDDPLHHLSVASSSAKALLTAHLAVAHLVGWDPTPFAQVREAVKQGLTKWRADAGIPPQQTDLD